MWDERAGQGTDPLERRWQYGRRKPRAAPSATDSLAHQPRLVDCAGGAGILMLTAYANSNIANYVFDRPDSGGASSALPAAIGTAASLLFLLPFRPLVAILLIVGARLCPLLRLC